MTKGGQPGGIQTATEMTFLGLDQPPIFYSGMQDQDFGSVKFVIDCLIYTFEALDDLIYSGSELGQKSIHTSLLENLIC